MAQFPWDPKPEPVPAPVPVTAHQVPTSAPQQPAQTAAANYTQATLSPQIGQPLSLPPHNGNGVGIKPEPGLVKSEPGIKQEPGANGIHNPVAVPNFAAGQAGSIAQQRAATALGARYGDRAAASIHAIHATNVSGPQPGQQPLQQVQQGQQQGPPQHGLPQQMAAQRQQLSPQQQYQQGLAAQTAQMQQRLQPQQGQQPQQARPPNGLPAAQLDGPSDGFEGVLMRRDAQGRPVEMGRVEIDNLLHAQIAARAKQMEGGGLMLPIKEATRHRSIGSKNPATAGVPSQVDGPDDDIKDEDLDDDDAINSDLDDSDDNREEDDDDDDSSGHMMLCMYDKVQRVKNKW